MTSEPGSRDDQLPLRVRAGIRVRIVTVWVLLLAGALTIVVVVARTALSTRVDRDIDRALVQEVDELRAVVDSVAVADDATPAEHAELVLDTFLRQSIPSDDEAFYSFVDGEVGLRSFGAPVALLDDAALVAEWTSATDPERVDRGTTLGEIRSLSVPLVADDVVGGHLVLVSFPEDRTAEVASVVRLLALIALAVLALTAIVAWTLARRLVRPIRELTETARTITDSDLSTRIPVRERDELGELAATFNSMLDRLEDGFGNQRQFLDDVAHELRTPITIARGHLELLGDHPSPQELAETREIVRDELDTMSRYVDDLLLLAKSEQPDFLRLEPTDLGELALHVHARAVAHGDRDWRLDVAPPPGHVAAVVDPDRLSQAVLNLVGNAVQHTSDGDQIGVGVAIVDRAPALPVDDPSLADRADIVPSDSRRLRVWVRDTGTGIDPLVADRLFERGARRRSGDGMGIGLSIVDAIARAHGGTVDASPTEGGGATFTLDLPLPPDAPIAPDRSNGDGSDTRWPAPSVGQETPTTRRSVSSLRRDQATSEVGRP